MEQRIDGLHRDAIETKKDIDIKFGSKNLLNFGIANQDPFAKKEIKEHIKNYIDERINPLAPEIEAYKKEVYHALR